VSLAVILTARRIGGGFHIFLLRKHYLGATRFSDLNNHDYGSGIMIESCPMQTQTRY